ncbi:GNAT superfamily N-acetyltransferase [Methanolinea mesophila]|uniref:GNAT family N-acetyltransferase n=1 Tax=Methanolinea mesophila TaxID=547055 RepID=UPI001AE4BB3C|nr:GNAT family N-acetyltransferase [Methanolinea mesophila]MBP1929966.1 GNAT superfamily N-acetyltransferase [Methanolinea mesophila]
MTEKIREIKQQELGELLSLYRYLNPDDPELHPDTRITGIWDRIMADPGQHYLVAEVDGTIVASCVLVIVLNLTRDATPYALIENVVTRPEYRRRGIGTRLLQRGLDIARQQGCYKVMLLSGRKDAIPFYEHAGFERESKTGFIARFDGR